MARSRPNFINSLISKIDVFFMILLTKIKMSFTWNELVCHGLLKKMGDCDAIRHVMRFVKPMRRDYLGSEAREYHMMRTYYRRLYPERIPRRRGYEDLIRTRSDHLIWLNLTTRHLSGWIRRPSSNGRGPWQHLKKTGKDSSPPDRLWIGEWLSGC